MITKEYIAKLFTVFSTAYPRFDIFKTDKELNTAINLWQEMLKDLCPKQLELATKRLIATSPYPPSISDIRRAVAENETTSGLTATDAWSEVMSAVHNYGSYRQQEAIDSLSELTRKCVEAFGWKNICFSTELGVTRGQFLKMYEQIKSRKKDSIMIPDYLESEYQKLLGGEEDAETKAQRKAIV